MLDKESKVYRLGLSLDELVRGTIKNFFPNVADLLWVNPESREEADLVVPSLTALDINKALQSRISDGSYEKAITMGEIKLDQSGQEHPIDNEALAEKLDVSCMVYVDEILIHSEDPNRNTEDMKSVLKKLREAKLWEA